VTVQGSNTPPTVSITNPVNNTVLIAPATFTITANAADPDGTVSQVEFFRDTTFLGLVTTSPYSTNVNNLAAGTYTISAVATDNLAAKATNSIIVSVVTPVAITLSAPQYLSATQFQFRYTANPGLRYVVERSPLLTNWTSVTTNTASSTSELFQDDITNGRNFYRVERLPNP
jgi:hypothetical protein